jgi:hypothetical protein
MYVVDTFHAAREESPDLGFLDVGIDPVVRGTGILLLLAANEGVALRPGHVLRVRVCHIAAMRKNV